MSAIIEFLKGVEKDNRGRMLEEILNWPDNILEYTHDVIQWLFPLPEPSLFNPDAPVLSKEDIHEMKTNKDVQAGILKSFDRFTQFYDNPQWLTPNNHNYLRLTRILKCLELAGLNKEKEALKGALNAIYIQHKNVIGEKTKKYWDEA